MMAPAGKKEDDHMHAINTFALTKQYGNLTAVDSLNLEVSQGELFSLTDFQI